MPLVSSILVPIDFSERSLPTARYAAALGQQFGASVTLLHVLAPLDVSGAMFAQLEQQRENRALQEIQTLTENTEWLVVTGDPARTIVGIAHSRSSLILMPTHGYGPYRRFILGSTAAKVLHDADCPVWTGVHVADAPTTRGPLRRVLCAVDLGPQSSMT